MMRNTVSPRALLALGTLLMLAGLVRGTAQTNPAPAAPHLRPLRVSAAAIDGDAALRPRSVQAGTIGTYELRITVGATGVATRGSVLVGFPKAWFVNPFPIAKQLQIADSAKPHFLSVTSSRSDAAFAVTVDTTGFTGKIERFNQTIAIVNTGSPLRRGDTISVTLARTTAPYISGADEVRVAVDPDGSGRLQPFRTGARYEVLPGPAADFTLVAPTEAVVGEPIELQLTAFDRFWNVADGFTGSVAVTGIDDRRSARLTHGVAIVKWTPAKESFYFPQATVQPGVGAAPASIEGNPVRVFAVAPATRTYWGELHSHSSISPDGIGTDPFSYARDVARLDFFAATEHADDDGNPRGEAIRPEEWQSITDRVQRFYQPGRFATLLAYECSFSAPSGHHNVFFRSTDGVPLPAALMGSVENLWSRIAAGEAITIPHHMGIAFGGAPPGLGSAGPELQPIVSASRAPVTTLGASVDWRIHDPVKRPLLEIYSLHGSSEVYDPDDSLAYENAGFTFSRSVPGPHYARDAWAAGLQLGVVAASDNHSAQPGQPQGGMTAVRAPRLTREAVFDALASRHTYGTTGQRIYIDLQVAGVAMGQAGRAHGPVQGTVTVAAPSEIARAEILRRELPSGDYQIVAHWDGAGRLLQTGFTDAPHGGRVMYYLRLQLKETVRGRVVRGWSSPIWLDLTSD